MATGEAQALAATLRARRDQIESSLLTRVYAVSDPYEVGDPEYALGLRTTVAVALDYALAALGAGEAQLSPLPAELPAQARAAARAGVSLDVVLRRYFAGYTLLIDCLVQEARVSYGNLAGAMRSQAHLFDRLIAAVAEAYSAEAQSRLRSADQRQAEKVRRLLRGELVQAEDLDYVLSGWHLGIVATGPKVVGALRSLAARLDRRLLLVVAGGGVIWAWLGGRSKISAEDAEPILMPALGIEGATMAFGEPGRGIDGWRASHSQAAAALPVAQRSAKPMVRYANVALLAASLHDEVLARSLQDLYLRPLAEERYSGQELHKTVRAYRDAGHRVSSAASALGVNRNTVASRLRTVEEALGRSLLSCGGELDVALRLEELESVQRAVSR